MTMHPSAPAPDAALTPPSTTSWAGITGRPRAWWVAWPSSARFLTGVEHVDPAHQHRRAPVRDRGHLAGLALAAVERAAQHPGRLAAHRFHGAPEVGRGGLVGHVAQLAGQLSTFDAVEALPGELEVVALHVDRPALVAHDVDAAL